MLARPNPLVDGGQVADLKSGVGGERLPWRREGAGCSARRISSSGWFEDQVGDLRSGEARIFVAVLGIARKHQSIIGDSPNGLHKGQRRRRGTCLRSNTLTATMTT